MELVVDRDRYGRVLPGCRLSPKTEFKKGDRPSVGTEFKPGQHASSKTEFKKGQSAHNRLPIGAVSIRIESNTKLPRAWIKVAEPNVWKKRAIVVWEGENGPVPAGFVIHHQDRDSLNDDISNLQLLSRSAHRKEHENEVLAWRKS